MNKQVISARALSKTFRTKVKEQGMFNSIKALIKPKYKKIRAVSSINFSIREGEIVGFIGPNGAGKSTTLKMLSGILYPDNGEVSVLGLQPWSDRKKLSHNIGVIFGQKPQLSYHLPAIDSFRLLASIYDIPRKKFEKTLAYYVKLFKIEKLLQTPVRMLSLGERMRCELVGSLLHSPKLLFLDEPTIGMDVVVKHELRELIKLMNKKKKITVLITSHDMNDIEQLCDRVIIINHGKILYDGQLDEVVDKYANKKIIKLVFTKKTKLRKIANCKTLNSDDFSATIEVDTKNVKVSKIVSYLTKKYSIDDIDISDQPIEQIIKNIFKEGL